MVCSVQRRRLTLIAVLTLGIAALHYFCRFYLSEDPRFYRSLPAFFYIPILLSAFWWGWRGGALAGFVCTALNFVELARGWGSADPNRFNDIVQSLLFPVLGILLGALADAERRAKLEKHPTERPAGQEAEKSIRDGLTGAYHRRHLDKILAGFWNLAEPGSSPFSLMMLDLNDFKKINERYGRPFGDRVLQSVVQTAFNNTRKTDMVFRYGGDEFLLLLPMTRGEFAVNLANRLREEFGKLTFRVADRDAFKADFSVGVLEYRPDFVSLADIFAKLDQALQRAKKEVGRIALAG